MRIRELIEKYFEGETTSEEERMLRSYFTSAKVEDDLKIYIPLFTYFEEEIQKEEKILLTKSNNKKRLLYLTRGIAASLLVLIIAGIGQWIKDTDDCLCYGDYVVINGKCYTDPATIRTYAFGALQEVATPAGEYFPDMEKDEIDKAIIEKQLSELSDLFSDDF